MNILINSCDEYIYICLSTEHVPASEIVGSLDMFSFRKYRQLVFKVVVWKAQTPCWHLTLSLFIILVFLVVPCGRALGP